MKHFQERRSDEEHRQYKGKERRNLSNRRGQTPEQLEFNERARYKAWMSMTDKNPEG